MESTVDEFIGQAMTGWILCTRSVGGFVLTEGGRRDINKLCFLQNEVKSPVLH